MANIPALLKVEILAINEAPHVRDSQVVINPKAKVFPQVKQILLSEVLEGLRWGNRVDL